MEEVDEEPALLMTQIQVSSNPAPTELAPPHADPAPLELAPLHIAEPRAQALLIIDDDGDRLEGWYLGTGATNHMTGRCDVFAELDRAVVGTVKFGDGSLVDIRGCGTVIFTGENGEHKALSGVYYIPQLRNSILSIGQIDESGSRVLMEDGVLRIWDRQRRLLAKVKRGRNRLYVLHLKVAHPICLAARHDDDAWRWHDRFGHINFNSLEKMSRQGLVRGLPWLEHVEQLCDTCVVTKHRRAAFPKQSKYCAQEPLGLVHGDLYGPITSATPGGRRHFLLLVDDATRYVWVVLLTAKSGAPDAIKRIQAAAELQSGRRLRVFRTDNGGEFTSLEFAAYCVDQGMQRHFSAPYAPQQNGVIERRNQSVVSMARALLKQRSMPAEFWGEAVTTAVFLLNRSPTKSLVGKTPYEAWHGRKPAVQFLRTFGCLAYVKEQGHLRKLDDRNTPVVFIGYEEGMKAYRFLDPMTRRVRIARDVVFDEDRGWNWAAENCDNEHPSSDFTIEYTFTHVAAAATPMPSDGGDESVQQAQGARTPSPPAPASPMPTVATPSTPTATSPTPEFVSPPANDSARLDAAHDDTPVRYRTVDNLIGEGATPPGFALRELDDAKLHMASTDEPCSYAEAERDEA